MTTTNSSHGLPNLDEPFVASMTLDLESPIPLYQQISTPLEDAIRAGKASPGQLIEDEVSMARRLEVSRPTVRRALADLVSRGLLTRKRGAGTRVTPTHVRRSLELTSLWDDLANAGFAPTTSVLRYEVLIADSSLAERLGIEEGMEVARIVRLRSIDQRPLALMSNTMPAELAPSISELNKNGLYASLAERGIKPVSAQQSIGARACSDEEAQILKITPHSPILSMTRTAYDSSGQVIEYGEHIYDAAHYSFHFSLASE